MKFRTEIGPIHGSFKISHDDSVVMLGSCFADNIGSRLESEGFDVVHNPLGPLYNPASIATVFSRLDREYGRDDLLSHDGRWHCMDFASRYSHADADCLLTTLNQDFGAIARAIRSATVVILTFGTTYVYSLGATIVGNCHKLPDTMFDKRPLTTAECLRYIRAAIPADKKVILTLSPVRYPGYGLTGDSLSKATLRVAIAEACAATGADYFPSYEIVNDDLRDYRFYAADLKHPSETAVDYIYEHFCDAYFDQSTKAKANDRRREYLRSLHRQILNTNE